MNPPRRILLTGATGYIGSRLAPRLLDAGYDVRCLVRSAAKLNARPWSGHAHVEVREVDLLDVDALTEQMRGCDVAYYLVHSMQAVGRAYARHDRDLATAFAAAAERAGVGRIIYLGGLGEMGAGLSEHLTSRREVESRLASTSVPVTVLRAAMIVGSGSASFEVLRYLVERLPIMITPRWVSTQSQPIAVRNVLHYLTQCLQTPQTIGATMDVGGPEVLSYHELMRQMAEALGLSRRVVIPVPLLTPRLSSMWIHLVTPISYRLARPLAEGLRNRVVCRDDRAHRLMPQPLLSVRESIDAALQRTNDAAVESSWSDAGVIPGDPQWAGGAVFNDERTRVIDASGQAVFDAICRVGGGHGYYAADWLWRLRGAMDRVVGGPGLRRGRRHPEQLIYGDALDFWRVVKVAAPHHLRLIAEMKLPGIAQLEFSLAECNGRTTLKQRALFKPRGLWGLVYWYAALPVHGIVFESMLNGIVRAARHGGSVTVGSA